VLTHQPRISRILPLDDGRRTFALRLCCAHWRCAVLVGCLVWLCLGIAAFAQEGRLIDSEPLDVIVLNEANQAQVLRVMPLDSSDRKLARKKPGNGTLLVRLLDNPDEQLAVQWSGIAEVQLFEDRVLQAAKQMVAERKFDEAFEYVKFVKDNYPDTPGVEDTIEQLLYTEASALYRDGDLDRAVILLDEIHQRNPNRRGLDAAMARVLGAQFQQFVEAQDYLQARRLYELAADKYRQTLASTLDQWRQQLEAAGRRALSDAQRDLAEGRLRTAYLSSRRVLEIWPATPGASELSRVASQRYPLIRVGVLQADQAAGDPSRNTMFHWAARRTQRLRTRQLFEMVGVTPDGGQYASPVGSAQVAENNRKLSIEVAARERSQLTSVQIAQLLLQLGKPELSVTDTDWFRYVERVSAPQLTMVEAYLRRPHLRAESLLSVPLTLLPSLALQAQWKPYLGQVPDGAASAEVGVGKSSELQMMLNPDYLLATATQPREVVERVFASPQQAVRALQRGELDLIDRVFPADVGQLQRDQAIELAAYRIPTSHVLVPNNARPYFDNRVFRRGLAYAIDREKILRRDLLAQADLPGCKVISGPFPSGIGSDDPLAYAYDFQVEPRAYDPRHAKTLLQLAQLEVAAVAAKRQEAAPTLGELVLVHPDGELARVACEEIAEDLRIIGLTITLRSLPSGAYYPSDDQWDLLYLDYAMAEPLTDARQLLAADGLVASTNPHLNLALRQLDQAISWNQVGERLRTIHQLTFDDTTVIPLWQLVDYQARSRTVSGLPAQPITTYQDIEQWRLTTQP
jgi:tetratricopeptide (TPR) repeat protein